MRRRRLFWQLFVRDTWMVNHSTCIHPRTKTHDQLQSCAYGRPPLVSPAFIDCVLPNSNSDECTIDPPPRVQEPPSDCTCIDQPWLAQYTKLLHNVMVSTFGSNRPSYQHILQLDTAIRNFPILPKMDLSDCAGEEEGPLPPADTNIVRWLGVSNKESSG